jgi:hypothetical protein
MQPKLKEQTVTQVLTLAHKCTKVIQLFALQPQARDGRGNDVSFMSLSAH